MNREVIEKSLGCMSIGCYDNDIDKLSKSDIKKVCDKVKYYPTSTIKISKDRYVECAEVEDEVDFRILSKSEYMSLYGDN